MIAHIVLFRPRAGVEQPALRSFAKSILESAAMISAVRSARIGRSVKISPGYERSMGHSAYEYAAVFEFSTSDDLIAYLRHPSHAALGRQFWEICESTVVLEVDWRAVSEWTVDELV